MAPELFYHPFSSYSWKVLIALYEAGTAFAPRVIDNPETAGAWQKLWPIGRFPVLVDGGQVLPEASIIIEPSTGWSFLVRHASPAARRPSCSKRTSRPSFRSV